MKEFSCGSVIPNCDATFERDTEEQILADVAVHAREDHGIAEVPPEVVAQVRANIHEVS